MQYTMEDLEGDHIIVVPADKDGIVPKVAVLFLDEDGEEMAMLLDDRGVQDFTTAMQMALKESERAG